ncbi:hypothetical protein Moror_14780 [Moniliophthora roreri MCA 2997]|uniref:Uncharacterized protein n=1 Tax=Moniliophthora roreri (strain MCA 2997) TaxID=1381753 RepID=V2X3G6_MONRO|nr:hypothetical protein Moror_14780 [Moniliophthora roreri MCA 2997]
MVQHRGFTACILDVETGHPLPEYHTLLNPDKNQVSCWIPSREEQKFSVYWEDLGGGVDTCGFILVDGVVVPGRFLFGFGSTRHSGIKISENMEKPFTFRKVVEHTNSLSSSTKNAGMIILKIKRVKRRNTRPPDELPIARATQAGRQVGDMYVGFGEERTSERYSFTWDVEPYDHDNPPGERGIRTYVSFVFRYRPLGKIFPSAEHSGNPISSPRFYPCSSPATSSYTCAKSTGQTHFKRSSCAQLRAIFIRRATFSFEIVDEEQPTPGSQVL